VRPNGLVPMVRDFPFHPPLRSTLSGRYGALSFGSGP
jgi:hypothetical protein